MDVHRPAATNNHLTNPNDLRCKITDAMNADQCAIAFQKDQLQESAAAGNGAARGEIKVCTADLLSASSFTTLLLGEARSRDLRHAVDCRDRTRIDDPFERNPEGMTDRHPPLLHCDRCQRGLQDIASGVDTLDRGAKVPVHDDSSPRIPDNACRLKAQVFRIRNTARGEEYRIRRKSLPRGELHLQPIALYPYAFHRRLD